jgi:hypothetical protein
VCLPIDESEIFFPMGIDSPNHTKSSPTGTRLFFARRHPQFEGNEKLTHQAHHRPLSVIAVIGSLDARVCKGWSVLIRLGLPSKGGGRIRHLAVTNDGRLSFCPRASSQQFQLGAALPQ